MPRLRHTNGAVVVVPDEKVDAFLRGDFTVEEEKKAAPTSRRSSPRKSEK